VIAADRDVARHEVRDVRVAAAEHERLVPALERVVLDEVRPVAVRPLIACESPLFEWHSPSQLSTMPVGAVERHAARRSSVGPPCT
jgi:hypothetical protein